MLDCAAVVEKIRSILKRDSLQIRCDGDDRCMIIQSQGQKVSGSNYRA